MRAHEVKSTAISLTSRVEIEDELSTSRKIAYFSDDTIGVYEVYRNKSAFGSRSYTAKLKIYQTNPLRHLATHVIAKNTDARHVRCHATPMKLDNTYIFLDAHLNPYALSIYDIKNRRLGNFTSAYGKFLIEKAIQLNSTCFAVPVATFSGHIMLRLFKLENGVIEEFKKVYLTRNHSELSSGYDDAAKIQNAELPFTLTHIDHLERLTDDAFIIKGGSGKSGHVVLKCNFNQDTITNTNLTSADSLFNAKVTVLNPKQLLCIGWKDKPKPKMSLRSQVWQLDEKDQATLKFDELIHPIIQKDSTQIQWGGSAKSLPSGLGFIHETQHCAEPVALHLFGNPDSVPIRAPHELDSVLVTKNGIVYADKDKTYLSEISLDALIQEQRHKIKNTHRAEIFTPDIMQQELLQSTKLPEVLINLVRGYAEPSPESEINKLVSPTHLDSYIEKLFQIIKDDKYLPSKYAKQMSSLREEKQTAPEMLKKLKDIVKQYEPKGWGYALFSYDGRTEPEKILFQLVTQLNSFYDLIMSPHFERLLDNWNQFHDLPRRSIWEY